MHPSSTPVRAEDQPVDAAPLQEQDFVAVIEHADLGRAQFIRAIEQPDKPVSDLPALVIIAGFQAAGRERQAGRLGDGPQRIRPANLL
jgi:hypothetical protein